MSIARGGAHVSIDTLGSADTCNNSIANLRERGKHFQVSRMTGDDHCPALPKDNVIANGLAILGSHGIQALEYPTVLVMIESGNLHPEKLIGKTIRIDESPEELSNVAIQILQLSPNHGKEVFLFLRNFKRFTDDNVVSAL